MKYCVSTYSFGRYGSENSLGIYGMIDKAFELGFDGIEFTEGYFINSSDDELRRIGNYARSKGLEAVALCVAADLIKGRGVKAEDEIKRICTMLDKASLLGVSMFRHDVAWDAGGRSYTALLPRLTDGCRRITEYAKKLGIKTMTENHGYYMQNADMISSLVSSVKDTNFGVLIDVGNFMCADEDPVLSTSCLAEYAVHVHCKDFLYKDGSEERPGNGWFETKNGGYLCGTIIGNGVARANESLGILKRSGYDGWITIEFEGLEDNLQGIELGLLNTKKFWENN